MEQRQQLFVGNFDAYPPLITSLDLNENRSHSIKFRIADIRDIRKRAGSNSPSTWRIPGTPKNNVFFGGVYDIGADFEIFNPNKKVSCKHIIDDEEVIFGYLQLKEVQPNPKGGIVYIVAVFDQVASMYREIKDRRVSAIDFSDLNHTLNLSSLQDSWSGSWDEEGFFYPYMFDEQTNGVRRIEKFQPAIYEKLILDRIIKQSHPDYPSKEFTWSGTFKDFEKFEREVIPYSGDRPVISETEAASKAMWVGLNNGDPIGYNLFDWNPAPPSGIHPAFWTASPLIFDDETTLPYSDSNSLFASNIFTAPVDGIYKFGCDLILNTIVNYTIDKLVGATEASSEMRFSAIGGLEIRDYSGSLVNPVSFENYGVNRPYEIYCTPGNNVHSTLDAPSIYNVRLDYEIFHGSWVDFTDWADPPRIKGDFEGNEESGGIFMKAGWTAQLNVRQQMQGHRFIGETATNPDVIIDRIQTQLRNGSNFRSYKLKSAYVANQTVIMNDMIDANLKQKDIFDDIISRYNLYVYTNPLDENDIVFDFRDDFYASGPIVDWSKKRDNNNKEVIKMIGELQNAEFLFSYKKASDPINKAYSDLTYEDIYGQFRFFFSNDFVKGEKKISTPFEPTPFVRQVLEIKNDAGTVTNYSTAVVPAINVTTPKTKTRVLYARQGLLTDDVSINQEGEVVKWFLETKNAITGLKELIEITGYPYAGHYDHPINATFSLNFGNPESVMCEMPTSPTGWEPPANTLFQVYWRNTMQQLARGQMLKDDFYLTPNDIAQLRRNPNTKVFLENQYYFINQVLFEGNQNLTKLAKVELITVEGQIKIPISQTGYEGSYNDSGVEIYRPPGTGSDTTTGTGVSLSNDSGKFVSNVNIRGEGNRIGSYAKNITVTGNRNRINAGVENVIIENADNIVVEASNVTIRNSKNLIVVTSGIIIEGNTVIKDGNYDVIFNKIDGGRNSLRSKNARFKANKIDGGKNQLQGTFNDSSINKIDSNTGIIKII